MNKEEIIYSSLWADFKVCLLLDLYSVGCLVTNASFCECGTRWCRTCAICYSHLLTCLPSTCNVTRATKELNFKFCLF